MKRGMVGLAALVGVLMVGDQTNGAVFTGLGNLPGGDSWSVANDVSADGSTVVGVDYQVWNHPQAFRWTRAGGMVGLGDLYNSSFGPDSQAYGVSADGSVVVGESRSHTAVRQGFRWTQATGMVGLDDTQLARDVSSDGEVIVGTLPVLGGEAFRWTQASGLVGLDFQSLGNGVSSDGSVVVGMGWLASGFPEAFRWTEAGGGVGLGSTGAGTPTGSASRVSADGLVVVGDDRGQAFRWTDGTGMVGLSDLPGGSFGSGAADVSADGSVVVGWGSTALGSEAFIWDTAHGMRNLSDVLTSDYGLDLTGWKLTAATALSDDGRTIVGNGTNPDGNREGWIVTGLGAALVPEPSTLAIWSLLGGLGAVCGWRRRGAA